MLISVSDMGPLNCPRLRPHAVRLKAFLMAFFDPFHRVWNDLKNAMKATGLFKTLLQYSLLYNLVALSLVSFLFFRFQGLGAQDSFWPPDSSQVNYLKRALCSELQRSYGPHQEPFLSYIPLICRERRLQEPSTAQEREDLWSELKKLQSLQIHGPVVKLMRFWALTSFFLSLISYLKTCVNFGTQV